MARPTFKGKRWSGKMANDSPERLARDVVEACVDCGVCRSMMAAECLFFDTLYRLHDRAEADRRPLSSGELRRLVDGCHYCALCGCPDIRAAIIAAKTAFADRDGLALGTRLLEDVARAGRLCGLFPRLANRLLAGGPTARVAKHLAGIHDARRLPQFPGAPFDVWARRKGLMRKPAIGSHPRVAYFAGCTGRFLFPEVPRALVTLLQQVGVQVFYPEQQCCGMPTLLEGDRRKTMAFMGANLARLAALTSEGFTIVCSCPTCGFVLKKLLKERAYYAGAYQRSVGAEAGFLKVPAEGRSDVDGAPVYNRISRAICGAILKDDGYFADLDALQRIAVAEHTLDAGEYLERHFREHAPGDRVPPATGTCVYFAPCHQREQNMGRPYLELLQRVQGRPPAVVDGPFDCCGMGGFMGYKKGFHEASLRLGAPVMAKIEALAPATIVTDCLSCRLQFRQLTETPVAHPLEILAAALQPTGPRPSGKDPVETGLTGQEDN
jgi:glycerol-3-phosphate dehydrogenase subunit C